MNGQGFTYMLQGLDRSLLEEPVPGGTGIEDEETEEDSLSAHITEPFDPSLIRVNTKPLTIDLLLERLRQDELDLSPGFQRKAGIWKDAAQSRLIESILIRIPLPAFYMDATRDERWLVVDGLQRLTALKRFAVTQELRLEGLDFLTQFHGQTYGDLPRSFQRRILETQVTLYLIEEGTPATVKFNIFKRINTGGLPLSAQEIRHALNQGAATEILARLASSEEFKTATSRSIRDDRMGDRECILRFLAFCLTPYHNYQSEDFDGFLNAAMSTLNGLPESALEELDRRFKRAMKAAHGIFGDRAFRKRKPGTSYRYPISKALFEAWSVGLDHLSDEELGGIESRRDVVDERFVNLNQDRAFLEAISFGTGSVAKVRTRFSAIANLLSGVVRDSTASHS